MTLTSLDNRVAQLEKQLAMVLSKLDETSTENPTKVKKDKAPKKEKEEVEKKKRGMTGYLLYAKENRVVVKEEMVASGNSTPKPTEVITEVAKRWKALPNEERDTWNERAKTVVDVE